jgi:hypothetical protein
MKAKPTDQFSAFDDAMGKLLNVSYQELQERLEQENAAKTKGKKRRTTSAVSSRAATRGKTQPS